MILECRRGGKPLRHHRETSEGVLGWYISADVPVAKIQRGIPPVSSILIADRRSFAIAGIVGHFNSSAQDLHSQSVDASHVHRAVLPWSEEEVQAWGSSRYKRQDGRILFRGNPSYVQLVTLFQCLP